MNQEAPKASMPAGSVALSLIGLSIQARQVMGKTVAAVASMGTCTNSLPIKWPCELPTQGKCGPFARFCIHMSGKL